MAISYKRRVTVAVATDVDYANTVADRDRSIADSTTEAGTTFARSIGAGDNVQIDLGEIATAKALLIEFNAAINFRLTGPATDPIPLKPVSEGQVGVALLEIETTDGVWIENPSLTAAVSITLVAIGDN